MGDGVIPAALKQLGLQIEGFTNRSFPRMIFIFGQLEVALASVVPPLVEMLSTQSVSVPRASCGYCNPMRLAFEWKHSGGTNDCYGDEMHNDVQ